MDHLSIRAATLDDRERLLAMLSRSFSWPSPPSIDFLARDPHLFHAGRIADHLLATESDDETIVGVIGVYGFELVVGGVAVPGAAIGQVATIPERRGQGVMSTLIRAALARIREQGRALSWLIGERRRYAVHGWALGGATVRYTIERTLLPHPPDPSRARTLWPDEIVDRILASCDELPASLRMPRLELELLVESQRPIGVALGEAWLVHDLAGTQINFAGGPPEGVARLAAHVIQATAREQLEVVCADEPSTLSRLGARAASSYQIHPSCLWRIAALDVTLAAAAAVARGRVGPGSDALALRDVDTGERATIRCHAGEVTVEPGAGEDALALGTQQLSELCFGLGMLDKLAPQLRRDSPLRRVLPMPVHHLPFYRF